MSEKSLSLHATIPVSMCGERIDKVLADLFPDYSRARLNAWLKEKYITVDGEYLKSKSKVKGGETIKVNALIKDSNEFLPQDIPLDIVYEDASCLVLNKPAGLVVHPGAGNEDKTLFNALLHHDQSLNALPRAGLIHRIDKDTTGLLICAKTLETYHTLVKAMQARDINRYYYALVNGQIITGDTIDSPIGRDPRNRTKMAIQSNGKEAITHYKVKERFNRHTLLEVKLETGRTHQIRVHLASIRHPLVGDKAYGGKVLIPPSSSEALITALQQFKRQALHAYHITFPHPITKKTVECSAELPHDLKSLLTLLEAHDKDRDIDTYSS